MNNYDVIKQVAGMKLVIDSRQHVKSFQMLGEKTFLVLIVPSTKSYYYTKNVLYLKSDNCYVLFTINDQFHSSH